MNPGILDWIKIGAIIAVRYINYNAIEQWSRWTFHRQLEPDSSMPKIVQANKLYNFPGLPDGLKVPTKIPSESQLAFGYTLPYYQLAGSMFKWLQNSPISRGIPWNVDRTINQAFPKNEEGWKDVNTDEEFARLRLQGPNPFLLKYVGNNLFEVDYAPYFKNIYDPVKCVFGTEKGQFFLVSISKGDKQFFPGTPGWEHAKLEANALDVRYAVLTRHLLDTHLLIGQAFALAAFALGPNHLLRNFFHLFTYGSMVVNDFAYNLLITPASYFIQSNFISAKDCLSLFQNSMEQFSLDDQIVPKDIAKRGIDKIPHHPYVEDAQKAWAVFQEFAGSYIDELYQDDEAVVEDSALQNWYQTLASLLPNQDITDNPLDSKQVLVEIICCMLYNNVSHEVCGDYSVFSQSSHPDHKKIVHFERLKSGNKNAEAEMADVFLFEQGAFAGRFNVGGNNLMTLPIQKLAKTDQKLCSAVQDFQKDLLNLDRELEKINRSRKIPFLRMMPRKWEASISF